MKRLLCCLMFLTLVGVLAACGPARNNVFPPSLSLQQLVVQPNGAWQLTLRIQNNSYAGMDFQRIDGTLQVAGGIPVRLHANFHRDIPALAGDVVPVDVLPTPAMVSALAAVAAKGSDGALSYAMAGTVHAVPNLADHPDDKSPRDFSFSHSDVLSPVPGIAHTFR